MGRSAFVASLALAISFGTACSSTTVGGPEGTNGPTTSNPTTPSQDGGDGAEGGTNGSKDASTDDTNECPKTVTASSVTRPKPFRGQKKGACSAQDLSAFDTTGSYDDIAKKMTPECRACAISTKSDATWGATFATRDNVYFNFGGCLEARGESPTCARGIMTLVLCVSDACSSCSSGQESACRKSMPDPSGACYGFVESDLADCSPDANVHLDACTGTTVLSTICGGDSAPGCSTLAQQGASVTGVAGTTVPNFTGGTIANGIWVFTSQVSTSMQPGSMQPGLLDRASPVSAAPLLRSIVTTFGRTIVCGVGRYIARRSALTVVAAARLQAR